MQKEQEIELAENIRSQYLDPKESKLNQLTALNRRVLRPAEIISYIIGIVGALVLGVGMCLAMKVIGDLMVLGIVIGVVGIVLVSINYFVYKAIAKSRKEKYSVQILSLTDQIING